MVSSTGSTPRAAARAATLELRGRLVVDRLVHREELVEAGEDRVAHPLEAAGDLRVLGDDAGATLRVAQRRHLLGQRAVGDLAERRAQRDRVHRRREALQHADGSRGDLVAHVEAVGHALGDPADHLPPAVRHLDDLLGGHRERAAGVLDEGAHQRHLVAGERLVLAQVGVGDHLHDAHAGVGHRPDEGRQLVLGRVARAERRAVAGAVGDGAAGREAEGAGPHAVADCVGHPEQLVGGRRLVRVGAPLAHHVGAQRGVDDVGADVDRVLPTVERIEVLGERLPVPRQPLGQRRARDVLDALEHADQPVVLLGRRLGGGEPDAAVAHRHRRDAVEAGGGEDRVPGRLAVEVGVDVDEARRHHQAVGVDDLGAGGVEAAADLGDHAVADGDVGMDGGRAGAVDDEAVADDERARVTHEPILSERPGLTAVGSSATRLAGGPRNPSRGPAVRTKRSTHALGWCRSGSWPL